ncbi:porin, partial [Mesorhizobium sp. M2C.T.Ca.TU.002.02.1.1]|uniref:porin n=1 Tax=Mesorhizobium sp. M2C.T.Ca.TU.002.02.1.1 TaxID=2496788 RepID=UPI000FD365D2
MQGIHRLVSLAFLAAASGFPAAAAAKPVEYVKVCTAYGPNYYYSPGTDTRINA